MTRSVKRSRTFLVMWTLAVLATASAFVVHLALRGRTVALGYEIGRSRAEQARLREVKRVLELESASYQTPERVEMVSRTLLGMEPPTPDRVVILAPVAQDRVDRQDDARDRPSASGKTAQGDSRDSRDSRESPP